MKKIAEFSTLEPALQFAESLFKKPEKTYNKLLNRFSFKEQINNNQKQFVDVKNDFLTDKNGNIIYKNNAAIRCFSVYFLIQNIF